MATVLGLVVSRSAAGLLVICGLRMIREETAKKASCQARSPAESGERD